MSWACVRRLSHDCHNMSVVNPSGAAKLIIEDRFTAALTNPCWSVGWTTAGVVDVPTGEVAVKAFRPPPMLVQAVMHTMPAITLVEYLVTISLRYPCVFCRNPCRVAQRPLPAHQIRLLRFWLPAVRLHQRKSDQGRAIHKTDTDYGYDWIANCQKSRFVGRIPHTEKPFAP